AVAHGDVDGTRSIRRRPRISAGDPVDSDGKRVLVFLGQGLYATGERMLRDSERRQIQSDSHITCDSEQGRVQPPVAVDHEHIGARGESSDRRLDSGELPIGEIGRDIRKVHPSSDESNLDRLEIRERDGSRGRVHLVTLIRHIDAGDDLDRPAIVVLDDLRSEPLLLCTKDPEEFDVRQGGDDSGFIDAAPGHGKALLTELLFGRGEDGPTVLANDPVAPPRVRMCHKTRGGRWSPGTSSWKTDGSRRSVASIAPRRRRSIAAVARCCPDSSTSITMCRTHCSAAWRMMCHWKKCCRRRPRSTQSSPGA